MPDQMGFKFGDLESRPGQPNALAGVASYKEVS